MWFCPAFRIANKIQRDYSANKGTQVAWPTPINVDWAVAIGLA